MISGLGFHCIDVVYTDVVALTAAEPLGDIYRRMIINFQQDGFGPGDEDLVFVADTDGLAVLDDIGPRVTIPEPVTASLALMSFAGLAMRRRRLMSL